MKRNLMVLAMVMMVIPAADAAVVYSPGPGTGAFSGTLGGWSLVPVFDDRPLFESVTDIPILFGEIGFSTPMSHRRIGSGWGTWSHGYTGDVYYSNGATEVTITIPLSPLAFAFYVEPNPFQLVMFEAIADDGTSSGSFVAHGSSGATFVGFYETSGSQISSIHLSGETDFAVGEFYYEIPEPASLTLLAVGSLALLRRR